MSIHLEQHRLKPEMTKRPALSLPKGESSGTSPDRQTRRPYARRGRRLCAVSMRIMTKPDNGGDDPSHSRNIAGDQPCRKSQSGYPGLELTAKGGASILPVIAHPFGGAN